VSEDTKTRARFQLSGHVLHDAIDGEVIVIDLSTGTYYSLRGSAAEVWQLIQQTPGVEHKALAGALAARYQSNGHDVEGAVIRFVGELHAEGLVSAVEEDVAVAAVAGTVDAVSQASGEFAPPVLEKYTDMQDLVLIDPVHDVSGAGWPQARPDVASSA
jgi:Coenzyme PQQ synthesis protein D (PqqD)